MREVENNIKKCKLEFEEKCKEIEILLKEKESLEMQRKHIENEKNKQVHLLDIQQFNRYVSLHWESLCRKAVPAMEIDGIIFKEASRWWGSVTKDKSIELDVVSESICGKYILIGECKWTDNENIDKLMQELSVKVELCPFIKDKIVIKRLFLKSSSENNSDVVITPDDVIKLLS